ncbi:aminotransferase class IV [Flagellimonas zhangzhouensis]|uniref:D-alanine transaminase n=1 Tax=Flagellimonas zhangzhouensis TaxID=1073328 RepID=A0A1H2YNH3_9FLAO|nr:aminotransferase class IV [Allomuricauda zhangzhouensis]SDR01168.1 D-alanine transaminase [Allomuricauda zhangzhouensis]SDX06717.1 D-alanine transaminase [Allomuricauda zhangzhouensis]
MLPKGNFPQKVYLNGEIIASEDANISVFDRGFLFGDGIYEVMVQLENGIFYKKAHLDRLQENLDKIGIDFDVDTLYPEIDALIEASGLSDASCLIYMQITRGTAPRKHSYPKGIAASVMMYALPFELPYINTKNMKAITANDFRWHRCDIKSISLLGNIMTNEAAMIADCDEAVLIRDGKVTEGSHTNIFFVKDSKVVTHPANEHILDGITRKVLVQLCKELDLPLIEKAISFDEIPNTDEAFFTGTTTQIASIAQLGEHTYYDGNDIGPITKQLREAFAKLKDIDTADITL